MAREDIYEARVAPQAGAPLPLAGPETFGAGVGRALEQVGGVVHATRLRTYELDRKEQAEREGADFLHKFALQRQGNDAALLEMQNSANPGGAGHTATVKAMLEAQREGLTSGITDDHVRRQALQQFDSYQTATLDREGTWENGQGVAKKVGDFVSSGHISNNRIRLSGGDAQIYLTEQQQRLAELDALDLPPDVRDRLKTEEIKQGGAVSLHQGLQDTNPRYGLALLDSGTFNDRLTPAQTDALRSGYQAEIRRQDALAQQAVSHEKSVLAEQAATITARAGQGDDVAAEAAALAPKLEAAGDTSGAVNMRGIAEESQYAKAFNGMTPLQRQAQAAEIEAIPEDQRTDKQRRGLKWLQDHKGTLDAKFNSDPVAWAMANAPSNAKPPSLEGPGGLAARAQWRRTQTYGPGTEMFTDAEATAIAEEAGASDLGLRTKIDQIAALPTLDAQIAAKQIWPNDPYVGKVIALHPRLRTRALDGRTYLKANPKAIDMADDRDKAKVQQANINFGTALQGTPEVQQQAILEVARGLMANFVKHGDTPSPELWRQAQSLALGSSGTGAAQKGGLGSWNGRDETTYLVPDGVTALEFQARVFGLIAKDPQKGPLYADGTPANLRYARPVRVGPNTYQFYVGKQAVLGRGKDGKITSPWQFRLIQP